MRIEEMDARKIFQENLKRLLANSIYDQKTLSEKVGVSTSNVSDWLAGKAYPRIGPMTRIAKLFNVPVEALVGRYEPNYKSYLILAYEQGTLEERIRACNDLNHNYFPVGDDRELIGITKICIRQINNQLIDQRQAIQMVKTYFDDSKLGGKIGCTEQALTKCMEAIAVADEKILDKFPYADEITDDNSACLTLLALTGHPYTPHCEADVKSTVDSRSIIPEQSKTSV